MDAFQEIKRVPELNFILLCAGTKPDGIRQERIKAAADLPLNWESIADICLNQRVLPLVYENIKAIIADKVPAPVYQKLKDLSLRNESRNLYILSMLLKILTLFKALGLVVIPFKGPVLAQDIYGDIGFRMFSDLDILVSQENALTAWQLLLENGFYPELDLSRNQILKYIANEDNISFFKTDNSLTVELHWEMSGRYLSKPLMLEHMEKRFDTLLLNKRAIPTLSSEDLLLYLCIHGAKHGWSHLELVCCISGLLKAKKDLEWNFIEQFACHWKCKNILWLGLYLSVRLLDAPVPEPVYTKIAAKKHITILAGEVLNDMFKDYFHSEASYTSNRFSNFHLKLKDSFFDKIRYSFRLIFRPTKKEWIYYPVPAPLSFLHFFLRPLRLGILKLRKQNA